MKITLANGLTLEGTTEQVISTMKSIGVALPPDQYYYSESKGEYLKISEMPVEHLRNAILKYYRNWVTTLSSITDPEKLLDTLQDGITDVTWLSLVKEYKRKTTPVSAYATYSGFYKSR